MSQAIAIREDHPSNPAIVQLIEKLDHFQSKLYPAESNHLLPIERLAASDVYLCSCTLDGVICGCGCFWMHDQFVEITDLSQID